MSNEFESIAEKMRQRREYYNRLKELDLERYNNELLSNLNSSTIRGSDRIVEELGLIPDKLFEASDNKPPLLEVEKALMELAIERTEILEGVRYNNVKTRKQEASDVAEQRRKKKRDSRQTEELTKVRSGIEESNVNLVTIADAVLVLAEITRANGGSDNKRNVEHADLDVNEHADRSQREDSTRNSRNRVARNQNRRRNRNRNSRQGGDNDTGNDLSNVAEEVAESSVDSSSQELVPANSLLERIEQESGFNERQRSSNLSSTLTTAAGILIPTIVGTAVAMGQSDGEAEPTARQTTGQSTTPINTQGTVTDQRPSGVTEPNGGQSAVEQRLVVDKEFAKFMSANAVAHAVDAVASTAGAAVAVAITKTVAGATVGAALGHVAGYGIDYYLFKEIGVDRINDFAEKTADNVANIQYKLASWVGDEEAGKKAESIVTIKEVLSNTQFIKDVKEAVNTVGSASVTSLAQDFEDLDKLGTIIGGYSDAVDRSSTILGDSVTVATKGFTKDVAKLEKGFNDGFSQIVSDIIDGLSGGVEAGYEAVKGGAKQFINNVAIENSGIWNSFKQSASDVADGFGLAAKELGSVSAKYESGGKEDTIANDPIVGKNYGKHQINSATGTMTQFLNSKEGSPYKPLFGGAVPGSTEFDARFREAVKVQGFNEAQKQFLDRTHYGAQAERIKNTTGLDVNALNSRGVKEMVYSTAIQYGGNTNVIEKALKTSFGDSIKYATPEQIIHAVQQYKNQHSADYFKDSFVRSNKKRTLDEERELLSVEQASNRMNVNEPSDNRDVLAPTVERADRERLVVTAKDMHTILKSTVVPIEVTPRKEREVVRTQSVNTVKETSGNTIIPVPQSQPSIMPVLSEIPLYINDGGMNYLQLGLI